MKDLVFVGPDVEAALAAASRDLGLPRERLRYVVLDPGGPERLGVKGQPARVAVLLDTSRPGTSREGRPEVSAPAPPPDLPRVTAAWLARQVTEAAGLEIEAVEEENDDGRVLRLQGAGVVSLLAEGGGDLLSALEHLLKAAFAAEAPGGRFRVECEGYREWRDGELQKRARALAEAVRGDGKPRRTEPLNSYERRLVHIAVSELPGLTTRSEGEGAGRYVVIALDPEGAEAPEVPPA